MECQRCGVRRGQIQVTRLIDGQLTEMLLCDECLREEASHDGNPSETANHMLSAILDAVNQSALQVNWIKTTSCAKCGMTYGVFREIGKMGCRHCYQTFGDRIGPAVSNWHGHSVHVGKKPMGSDQALAVKSELQSLHVALREAIQTEAFEQAALLRDQILRLEAMKEEGEHRG